MNAVEASAADPQRGQAEIEWAEIAAAAPQLAQTMRRYLRQAATFLAPASVDSADGALRIFAGGCWPIPASSRSPTSAAMRSRTSRSTSLPGPGTVVVR
jgi:non-ribosomal peptide synthetase component F